ncbi:hypothetical protein [Streptomyces sp. 769]|uniref:hypothetical protein n=1 Tax=Streptomyces sp. 769 TaxID=1262452 RepID=UPI00057E4C0A|nr:hypothetical protein [Streptomyces sp. 769]AJC60605.1 putative sensor with HAMP domain protein [Streptomyces sp. 769]
MATPTIRGPPTRPDTVLDRVGSVYQKWRGTAVIEIRSGKLLGARGENVPLAAIDRTRLDGADGLAPRAVRLPDGQSRLLTLALLSWGGRPQQLLFVLGPDGEVLARAGRAPHTAPGKGPSDKRFQVSGHGGAKPVVSATATAELPGRRGTAVVGEFRIDFLNGLLGRPGLGEVRVVDAEGRVIDSNTGYRAFQRRPDHRRHGRRVPTRWQRLLRPVAPQRQASLSPTPTAGNPPRRPRSCPTPP